MEEKEFNLLEQPWIRVMRPDCNVAEVSLINVFENASDYVSLSGELPTQDIAVLRVLLAILQTVVTRYDPDGNESPLQTADDAYDRWQEIWESRKLPMNAIRKYLEIYRDRFWLFHPERPFWQVPSAEIGTEYTAAKLNGEISESSNTPRLFSSVSGEEKMALSYAQAARWIICLNACDDASVKPSKEFKKKRDQEKKDKEESPGVGWLGKLGIIYLHGSTLFETLMLNVILLDENEDIRALEHPIWEEKDIRESERNKIAKPDNLSALYTMSSRRIHLFRNDKKQVVKYKMVSGDYFNGENAFIEPMTIWAENKKNKGSFFPKIHDSAKQFWREFSSVFPKTTYHHKQPGVISWFSLLQEAECLPKTQKLSVKICSIMYDGKKNSIKGILSDSLSMSGSIILESGMQWQMCIENAILDCEKIAGFVYDFAQEAERAQCGDEDRVKQFARTQKSNYYFSMNASMQRWISNIDPQVDQVEEKRKEILAESKKTARNLVHTLVGKAPDAALFVRVQESKTYSVLKALEWFEIKLYNI